MRTMEEPYRAECKASAGSAALCWCLASSHSMSTCIERQVSLLLALQILLDFARNANKVDND